MSETIAAIATGGTVSAIGIVRVSGDEAISAADMIFRAACGKKLADAADRQMYYGEITGADGGRIDLCLCMISRGPSSYTGEDTAEFHCHGSPVVLSEVLRALFVHGVRQAEAGEFTKRAFLNGRIDLTQAEAVIDLIEAETPAAAQNAAGQLYGAIGVKLESVYNRLLDVMAHFYAVIDYPDEDVEDFETDSYILTLHEVEEELSQTLATYSRGRVLRDGLPVAIAGRPNTGKSSLLNALLGYDRAIVTGSPGTTRDTIEEKILFGGLLLRLTDTAGIRRTDDEVERLGVERALNALRRASLVILVLDGSEPLREEDFEALRAIPLDTRVLIAVNKSDLPCVVKDDELSGLGHAFCHICALTGDGFDKLDSEIRNLFPGYDDPPSGEIITNMRQAEAISRAKESVGLAIAAIGASITPDASLIEIEDALDSIGSITGKVIREDVISRIFERFCVGK